MPHAKTQIREKAVALVTGLASTGASVFKSRVYPFANDALPAIAVYVLVEDPSGDNPHQPNRRQVRRAVIIFEIVAKANSAADDITEQIQLEVEEAIDATPNLDGLVNTCMYIGSDTELVDELEKKAAVTRVRYAVTYAVIAGQPGTILNS